MLNSWNCILLKLNILSLLGNKLNQVATLGSLANCGKEDSKC